MFDSVLTIVDSLDFILTLKKSDICLFCRYVYAYFVNIAAHLQPGYTHKRL